MVPAFGPFQQKSGKWGLSTSFRRTQAVMFTHWHHFHIENPPRAVVDPRRRMRICLVGFVILLLAVFGRAVTLEVTQGAAFRAVVVQPPQRQIPLPGIRGRILARDGTVLAEDKKILALSVQYRYLEEPPDPRWLRQMARKRLPKAQRRDLARVAAEEAHLQLERADLRSRLALLCGLSVDEWSRRAGEIQTRVERIAAHANRRRQESPPRPEAEPSGSFLARAGQFLRDALQASAEDAATTPIIVAEELDDHVMAEEVSLNVVAEIEGHGELYPGVRIRHRTRRNYPSGTMAAHVLGHLGPPDVASAASQDEPVGRMGVERQYEPLLHGRRGVAIELTDHSGRVLASYRREEPGVGPDLILSLDRRLQRAAEELLDGALQRRATQTENPEPAGGAIVVMDVRNGEILAAASAPRFAPGLFAGGDPARRAAVLTDRGHPLFDRTIQMALPPGSVFKTVAAVALLEAGHLDPQETFACRGYLNQPDRQRCAVYVRHGIGHGDVTLADALAQSCNVYFFHHAGQLDPAALVAWSRRMGFGLATGVDLPGEATGTVPSPETIRKLEGHGWRVGDTQAMAIGQGSLTATPLQIVRMMAAVANGGQLVAPHVVKDVVRSGDAAARSDTDDPIRMVPPRPIAGLGDSTLRTIREGLDRVVADPKGTAHGSVYLDSISIAGKTGTASVGDGLAEHAWFAGYVPADKPKLAMVVVLEHSGDAAVTAGPVVKRLVLHMQQIGLLTSGR